MKRRLAILALAIIVPVVATVALSAWLRQSDYFLLQFESVRTGMSESEVKSILGRPAFHLDTILPETSKDARLRRLIQKYGSGARARQWSYHVPPKTGAGFVIVELLNSNGEWRVVDRYTAVKKFPVSEQIWRSVPPWLQW